MSKPYSGHSTSGNFGNLPMMQDSNGVTSPIAVATDLLVPPTGFRLNLVQDAGSTGMTVRLKSGVTAVFGTVTIPNGVLAAFEVAGSGSAGGTFPNKVTVTPGTGGSVSFWFDCAAEVGATS